MTRKRWSYVARFIFGFVGSFALFSALFSGKALVAAPNENAPSNALLFVFAVAFLALSHFLSGLQFWRKLAEGLGSTRRPKLRRFTKKMGTRMLLTQLTWIGLIFVFGNHDGWTAKSVGFKSDLPLLISLFIGFVVYQIFVVVLTIAFKVTGKYEQKVAYNLQILAYLWPRSKRQRFLFVLAVCVMNPIVEELLFRGVLVHQFGVAINSLALPLVVGLIASLANHAYQGWQAVATHFPFYLVVIGLLYSPAGLAGAIGFHFGGDIFPFFAINKSLQIYREQYRRATKTFPATVHQIS